MWAYPSSWLERIGILAGPINLDVAGYAVPLDITPVQLEYVYLPLLALLAERATRGRVVAGLAGVPGSGKSTFAVALEHVADRVLGPSKFAVIGIDGWHYPNAILDSSTAVDAAGRPVPLRQYKGSPESFDVVALTDALRRLRDTDDPVRLPVYDRRLHDPLPDQLLVVPETRIILVEGNYLLSLTPPWDAVSALLVPRLFLANDPTLARERVIARHIRGGSTPAEAQAKYMNNDRFNAETVQATADRADFVIQTEPHPALRRVCHFS